ASGADPVVKTAAYTAGSGTFTVPARTVAVFTRAEK
ncbi:alpha-1,6-glucosidase domain-containing protein, partial [Streptomyces capoamus]